MHDRGIRRALREKYEAMLALREAHTRAREEPSFVEPDPKPALAALAARFPGALREIDVLPVETIRARLDALGELTSSIEEGRALEPWMLAQARFHTLARGALAAKRWLGREREVDDALRARFEETAPTEAQPWRDDLGSLARPPRGRLLDLVFARLADELGLDPREARVLVFGPPRRR